jgi:futalosine hydrolase
VSSTGEIASAMSDVLIVAATARELNGRDGLVCGVGPVEAAAATARALALEPRRAVLHVGLAGGRELAPGTLVIGAEAVYCDLSAAIRLVDRIAADTHLLAAARRALPAAPVLPIGTSAAVGGAGHDVAVEAMEGFGVLRAAALAGVPAVEVRAISNEIGEADRSAWRIEDALAALDRALPTLAEAVAAAVRAR